MTDTAAASSSNQKSIQWSEVAQHTSEKDCWIVVNNEVIDATSYLDDHPGGPIVITKRGGKDATLQFEQAAHSEGARKKLEKFKVGVIAKDSVPLPGQIETASNSSLTAVGLILLGIAVAYVIYNHFLQPTA